MLQVNAVNYTQLRKFARNVEFGGRSMNLFQIIYISTLLVLNMAAVTFNFYKIRCRFVCS